MNIFKLYHDIYRELYRSYCMLSMLFVVTLDAFFYLYMSNMTTNKIDYLCKKLENLNREEHKSALERFINTYNINSIKHFCIENFESYAYCNDVHDGDSIHIVTPFHNDLYKWTCRLVGIDAPEVRTKDKAEKEKGFQARDALRSKILDKIILVKFGEADKYGRYLVDVYIDNIHINKWMVENNYAVAYDGGTKKPWNFD